MNMLNDLRYIVENIPHETKKIMITSYFPKMGKTTYSKLLSEKLNDFILVDGDFYKPEELRIPDVIKLSSLEDLFLLDRNKKYIIDLLPLKVLHEKGHFETLLSFLKSEKDILVVYIGKVTPLFHDGVSKYVRYFLVSPIEGDYFINERRSWRFRNSLVEELIINEINEFFKGEFGFEPYPPSSLLDFFEIKYPIKISDDLLENKNVKVVKKKLNYKLEKSFCHSCYKNDEFVVLECWFVLTVEGKYKVTAKANYIPVCVECEWIET